MRGSIATGASLALVLLAGCAMAEDATRSGPQPGDHLQIFEPLNVTGEAAGERACQV